MENLITYHFHAQVLFDLLSASNFIAYNCPTGPWANYYTYSFQLFGAIAAKVKPVLLSSQRTYQSTKTPFWVFSTFQILETSQTPHMNDVCTPMSVDVPKCTEIMVSRTSVGRIATSWSALSSHFSLPSWPNIEYNDLCSANIRLSANTLAEHVVPWAHFMQRAMHFPCSQTVKFIKLHIELHD